MSRVKETVEGITFHSAGGDIYGNPRWIFHFLELHSTSYDLAKEKAKKIGAKPYKGKWFGGGLVITTNDLTETAKKIKKLKEEQ